MIHKNVERMIIFCKLFQRMTPKYAKILFFVIFVIILYKTFRYYRISEEELDLQNGLLEEKVKVSVYYEALCPDSKFFVTYQLLPVYEDFQKFINLDLVPYGKAQVRINTSSYKSILFNYYFRLLKLMVKLNSTVNMIRLNVLLIKSMHVYLTL